MLILFQASKMWWYSVFCQWWVVGVSHRSWEPTASATACILVRLSCQKGLKSFSYSLEDINNETPSMISSEENESEICSYKQQLCVVINFEFMGSEQVCQFPRTCLETTGLIKNKKVRDPLGGSVRAQPTLLERIPSNSCQLVTLFLPLPDSSPFSDKSFLVNMGNFQS